MSADPGHFRWSDKGLPRYEMDLRRRQDLLDGARPVHSDVAAHGDPPSRMTAFGKTHTCTRNNQHLWLSGCTDGAGAWGCGFYIA